ncbi:MAG: TonB-dependent receptor, partial [Bacteroidota bacterium]
MLELEYQLHHHNNFEGAVGASGMMQSNTYNGRLFIPNFKNQGVGAYWIERFHKGRWQIEAGARLDHRYLQVYKPENGVVLNPTFRYTNPSVSLGAGYRVNNALIISAFSGTAWRPPAVNELFSNGLHHGSATVEVGDSGLRPESNWNNSISAEYRSSKFSGEVSLYHNVLTGFINLVPSGQTSLTIRGAFPTYVYVQQNAIFKGIDASGKWQTTASTAVLGQLSVVRATQRGTRNYLSQIPPDRLKTGVEKQFGTKRIVTFTLSGTYVARQTRYAKQIVIAQDNGEQTTLTDFAPPPADYFLLEAEINTTIRLGKQPLFISLSGTNLLNLRYRSYLNRFRYFSDETGRNLLLKINVPLTIKKQ